VLAVYRKHHSTETAPLRVLSDIFAAADRQKVTLLGCVWSMSPSIGQWRRSTFKIEATGPRPCNALLVSLLLLPLYLC